MKQFKTTIFIFIIFILSSSFNILKSKKFDVEIIQNGKAIEIKDNVVELEKKEFKIKITLKNQDGVYMISSFNRDYYDLKDQDSIKDFQWLNVKTRAENNFNEDKELFIGDEMVSYLFYDSKLDWHRFDKDVIIRDSTVIGYKTIKNVYIEDTKKQIKLDKIKNEIYLFFVATNNWEIGEIPKDFGRLKLKIKWK